MAMNTFSNRMFSTYVMERTATLLTNGLFLMQLISGLMATQILNRFGRKVILGTGYLLMAILLALFAFFSSKELN